MSRRSVGYADPPQPSSGFNGLTAIGLAISMAQAGTTLSLARLSSHKMAEIVANSGPIIVIEPRLVADQSVVVEEAVGGFTQGACGRRSLISSSRQFLLSLGLRAGVVVACIDPARARMVFVYMEFSASACQRYSPLGPFIISLRDFSSMTR